MKVDIKKRKIVNESITYGNSVTSIYEKLINYYEQQYGSVEFKELILYAGCTQHDCEYMCNIINLMPTLNEQDSNSFIKLIKLYADTDNKSWPMEESEAVFLLEKMHIDFTLCELLKSKKIIITDINNGDWIFKVGE